MPLDYAFLKGLPPLVVEHDYTARDTMLYALGVGCGEAAIENPVELRYVYEKSLVALPSMAVVLAYPGFWARDPKYGITWQKLLHVEQAVEWFAPIPPEGKVRGEVTIDEIYDRGPERGALIYFSRRITDERTGTLLAIVRQVNLARADGGGGGAPGTAPPLAAAPARAADVALRIGSRPEAALIYRLSGDDNPLHADPSIAKAAGFDRPILHGLASYGVLTRAIVSALCGHDPARLRRFAVRFSNPVYPGETFDISIWKEGQGLAFIEASVAERGVAVLKNGYVAYDT